MSHKSLQGSLLLDSGNLQGSIFHRSVVLICHHDAEGAFGLILNHSSGKKMRDAIVANLPELLKEEMLYIGGPVQPNVLSYLHSDTFVPNANVMVNVNLSHSLDSLIELGESYSPSRQLKLFAGYAGWDAGQLDGEMARHDWVVHPASAELVFGNEPDLWRAILKEMDYKCQLLAETPEDISWN